MTKTNICPHCGSSNVGWKQKAGVWECAACEERFSGDVPSESSHALGAKATHPKNIFFSYGHDSNRELVELFRTDLEKRGHTVWIDWKEIGTWDDWKGRITRGIDASELTLAFITHHAMRDPGVCRNEIAIAMNRFGRVNLVLLESGAESGIPVIATDRQWADLSQWRDVRDGKVIGVDWERWYQEKLINLIERIEGEATTFADEMGVLRQVLSPSSFESRITQHLPGFVGREWVFDAYREWLGKPDSRLFWIKAGPGVGKSAIAANLVARERSAIVASWFCDAKSIELKNPDHAVRSLAFQLALRWEDYRVRLLRQLELGANATEEMQTGARRKLGRKNTQDLFRVLVAEPLNGLIWREHKLVIVVDALDEASDGEGNNRITELIAMELERLPEWIAFVVTSRPEADVVARLQGFKPFAIDATDERNLTDLHNWYQRNLVQQIGLAGLTPEAQRHIENLLIERSEGMFLYLKVIEEGLREGALTVEGIERLEAGLPGLYRRYFDSFVQRFGRDYEVGIKPLLRLLLAAGGALPEDLACAVLDWNGEQWLAARNRLGTYVIDSPAGLELFHKTLSEWLTNKTSATFFVDPRPARQAIADVLFAELAQNNTYMLRWREIIEERLPAWIPTLSQNDDPYSLFKLGRVLPRSFDARSVWERVLELCNRDLPRIHPLLEWALEYSSSIFLGREAHQIFHQELELVQEFDSAPTFELARLLITIGNYLWLHYKDTDAEVAYRLALQFRENQLLTEQILIIRCQLKLANLLCATDRQPEAELLLREALKLSRIVQDFDASEEVRLLALDSLATMLISIKKYNEAEPILLEALELTENSKEFSPIKIAKSAAKLIVVFLETNRKLEAEQILVKALKINYILLNHKRDTDITTNIKKLASLLENNWEIDEAAQLYRALLNHLLVTPPADGQLIYSESLKLAELLRSAHRYKEAELVYRRLINTIHATDKNFHSNIENCANCLADLLREVNHYYINTIWQSSDFIILRERIEKTLREILPENHPDYPHDYSADLLALLQNNNLM